VPKEQAFALALSVGALALGPLLYRALDGSPRARSLLDGFVLGSVGGLVVLHVLPRVFPAAGVWAVVAFLVGLLLPYALHRFAHSRSEGWVVGVGLFAVAAHATMDGAGIAHGEEALSVAIVLHRIPASVLVWWLLKPRFGPRSAALALVALAIATLVGFFGMAHVAIDALPLAAFEALLGGALLHVIAGHGNTDRKAHLVGTVAGVVAGLGLPVALLFEHAL
jgi:hypothetical protein